MDFDKPLSKVEGYITYAILMDYLDTFIHEYTAEKKGTEFPSLRMTTDMLLTLLNDFRNVDMSNIMELPASSHPRELIEKLAEAMEDHSNENDDVLDSRELGLFITPEERKEYMKDLVPQEADLVMSDEDANILDRMGIKLN